MNGWRDRDVDWHAQALCAQLPPETADAVFYGDVEPGGRTFWNTTRVNRARAICDKCPVWEQCLRATLAAPERVDQHGVRAGLLPRERATLREHDDGDVTRWLGGLVEDVRPPRPRAARASHPGGA